MQNNYLFNLPTPIATERLGALLAKSLCAPLIMTLEGEIGAGKTTLIRAMLKSLDVALTIKSPTFSIVESYDILNIEIHHFDLYRIHDISELDYIGFRDYFTKSTICLIEWPERAKNALEHVDLAIHMKYEGDGRIAHIRSYTQTGAGVISCLESE